MRKNRPLYGHLGRIIDKLSDHNKTTSLPTGMGVYVTQDTIAENGLLNFDNFSESHSAAIFIA